ncbi:MAG: hypothetical protein NT124_05340 [Candidatus Dependentiae bacterium]|nr:hypothetical protein [Candidatus Dependentiae bacterium]
MKRRLSMKKVIVGICMVIAISYFDVSHADTTMINNTDKKVRFSLERLWSDTLWSASVTNKVVDSGQKHTVDCTACSLTKIKVECYNQGTDEWELLEESKKGFPYWTADQTLTVSYAVNDKNEPVLDSQGKKVASLDIQAYTIWNDLMGSQAVKEVKKRGQDALVDFASNQAQNQALKWYTSFVGGDDQALKKAESLFGKQSDTYKSIKKIIDSKSKALSIEQEEVD